MFVRCLPVFGHFLVYRIYISDFYVQHNKECIIEKTYCSEYLPPAFAEAASRRQVAPLCPPGQRPYGPAAKEG
jgi:hypothetical protein